MASISSPSFPSPSTHTGPDPRKSSSRNPKFMFSPYRYPPPLKKSFSRVSDSTLCRCQNRSEDEFQGRLDSLLHEAMKNVTKSFDDFMKYYKNPPKESLIVNAEEKEVWDWDRWMKHIKELEEQEKIVSVLQAQLRDAVDREDFKDAAKLKVAIAAAAANDTVGRVISQLNRALEEERYQDAAFIRDNAGAGLVGWWAGISKGSNDPYGRIIHINAEHGRYVARSYSPRQLATATPGAPLFEIFLATSDKGEYKHLVVYLKRGSGKLGDALTKSSPLSDHSSDLNPLNGLADLTEGKSGLSAPNTEDVENSEDRDDDSDLAEGLTGFQNIMRDMIPDVKVKLLKVTGPGKIDKGQISKVVEQIIEEDEQIIEEDDEEENVELGTSDLDDNTVESDKNQDEIVMDSAGGISGNSEDRSEIAVKIVIGGLLQKLSNHVSSKELTRVPARLEKKGRLSFSFSINTGDTQVETGGKGHTLPNKNANISGHRSMDHIMSDMSKFIIRREKIPMKVLKDVGELINLSLRQAQNRQTLSGSTIFNRIEILESSDPLNGLYIGSHGIYSSEVIHLRRNFGQWQEDGDQKSSNLEFYEYVEALKLTGDPYVPAGQIAFRAKVGKQYQLPHKGLFPEELGVIARYKGQGRLAESGFRNPRWVDGELVIINSKYIKGGPVVGFVYSAPEYHFLVFFNRLRLQG